MKFLVSKDLHSNKNFTLLLECYAVMLLLYFMGDLYYMAAFFGHTPLAISNTLRGNPDEYIEPLTLLSMLEHIHISLFLAILALFTTMAVLLRLKLRNTHKKLIIIISMTSLLLAYISLIGGYFISPVFAYSFMGFTVIWHLSGIYALLLIGYELLGKRK